MKSIKLLTTLLLFCFYNGFSQSNVDTILNEIKKNNTTIKASQKKVEAQKVENKTGLSLYNPTFEYDYMKGTPANAGNQTDIVVSQSFDFPTAYFKKKDVSNVQNEQLDIVQNQITQEVLLEAKLICIELIHRNKINSFFKAKKQSTENWLKNFKKKLDIGDGNILDVNKAEVQFIETNKQYLLNQSEIQALHQKLTQFNGGNAIVLNDTIYSENIDLPTYEMLLSEYNSNNYELKTLEKEKSVYENKIALSKAMSLPKFELGYHYQGILGQTFNGIHTGITLPLWESKNTVKLQKANLSATEANIEHYKTIAETEYKLLYDKYLALKDVLLAYEKSSFKKDNLRLLNKALQYGQISTLEYFVELNYFNDSVMNNLETEKEFYSTIAKLMKYKL